MREEMSPVAAAYVQSTNTHNRPAFEELFADDAIVNDAGHTYHGTAAIRAWSDREIFDAQVTLEVIEFANRDNQTIVTTIVDGNFDRTGLSDPVVIEHHIVVKDEKIAALTCKLAGSGSNT